MLRILFLSMFSVALLSACASSSKDEHRAGLYLRSGSEALRSGNYPAALSDLLSAARLDPDNAVIQNNLGLAFFVREKYPEAEAHLRRALEIAPAYSDARNNRGRVLIEMNRHDEAIREIELVKADLTYPEPEKAWFNLGLAYFRKGDFAAAKEKFAEAIRLRRHSCLAQTFFGRSLLELADYDRAAENLDNATTLCKSEIEGEPQYYSGISYFKLGRTDKAVARMEEVIRKNPNGKYAKKAESMLQIMLK